VQKLFAHGLWGYNRKGEAMATGTKIIGGLFGWWEKLVRLTGKAFLPKLVLVFYSDYGTVVELQAVESQQDQHHQDEEQEKERRWASTGPLSPVVSNINVFYIFEKLRVF